ncbi:maleylpyruvate isomerase family mycothiol-dependent enzyme [Nocardia otitidiscaviarum]|uniref:maleylpyruvate isomerase family mycothiol-dependent enzyme n=1 Tax=Nocardia otitidiscaviarum TaxID=1823 RepID=UPI001893348E|nr:maleylpyruvate isomerase family mycothiol-dependent enzyme [Nocardia otitidiscaviarum]MBF6178933.1 maleylpyruvate isomerase family mycothiol-dependent enzyme [Nocardia otitidiscaviarum]
MTSDAPEFTAIPTQLDTVATATERLLTTVADLRDADLVEPSLLPGWTRGHVLSHLSRNADSLVNLLLWARTGIETPQYASAYLRDADIEAGAPRPLREQLDDLRAASDRWLDLARVLPEDRWATSVRNRQGTEIPATRIVWMRLLEVEIHHVDLAVAYSPADWPTPFTTRLLTEALADRARTAAPDAPGFTVTATDTGYTATVGSTAVTEITGTATALATWLIGRSDGSDLNGDLPDLTAWK